MARNATIALLLFNLLASACGMGEIAPGAGASPAASASAAENVATAPPASPSAAPTPTPSVVYWPLTGLPADDPAKTHLRPLDVRIPEQPSARPQVGLSKADLVFEMIVEGGATRFAAIYQSHDGGNVGPVRSYRWSDLHLAQMLRGTIVASGATIEERDAATRSMRAGNLLTVDADRVAFPYYRVGGRPMPNNMFVDLDKARQASDALPGGKDPVDVPPLAFFPSLDHAATAGGASTGRPATTIGIPFQREPVTFTYDAGSRGYHRTQAGELTVDGNVPILARNVIVMHTDIWATSVREDILGSLGLDYRMTGGGAAEIFRDGLRIDGTWRRDGVLDQFTFYDQAGTPILLEPGQSWIQFVYPSWIVTSSP